MNERMEPGSSISEAGVTEPADVLRLVTGRMLETRPKHAVRLRPYTETPIRQSSPFGPYQADFASLWPDSSAGDLAYAAARFHADSEQEVVVTISGAVKLWIDGRELLPFSRGTTAVAVRMKRGWNAMLIKCIHDGQDWGFGITIGFPRYPTMWAKDYLFSTRPTFPQAAMLGEEGFAYIGPFRSPHGLCSERQLAGRMKVKLQPETDPAPFGKSCWYEGELLEWHPKPVFDDRPEYADFCRLYGSPSSACAYGVTSYQGSGDGGSLKLRMTHEGPAKIWVNGIAVYRAIQSGQAEIAVPNEDGRHEVWVKSVRSEQGWGFTAFITNGKGERIESLPYLDTRRSRNAEWAYIGPFGLPEPQEAFELLDYPFDVERNVAFDRTYPTGQGDRTYWRLNAPATSIRPYLDGFFFGQWFYAIQLGLYGLLASAEWTDNQEQRSYVLESMSVMARYFDYAHWDKDRYGVSSLIPRALELQELDPCGIPGLMMIEAYCRLDDPSIMPVIAKLADTVMNRVPRLEDGTLFRIETMWADDLFMSCPFLARLGSLTGDARYFDEAVRQVEGFRRRLWIADKRLFSHIYFPADHEANRVPWGRGNGWILFALTEILLHLPPEHPGRETLRGQFEELAAGVAARQGDTGMWHQVLDEPDSYEETSCTAMFVLSMARGLRLGWFKERRDAAMEAALRGWTALLERCIDRHGNVYGVCLGSGCARDKAYYFDIPTYMNDDHGTGVVLLAAVEMEKLRMNETDRRNR